MIEKTRMGTPCSFTLDLRGSKIDVRRGASQSLTANANEIASLYTRVFEGKPWYEKYLVQVDGGWQRMGSPQELELLDKLRAVGTVKEEQIKPFYKMSDLIYNIYRVAEAKGSIFTFAREGYNNDRPGQIIGASWGMLALGIPFEEKLTCVKTVMEMQRLSPEQTFYFDETFVDLPYRGNGIGKALIKVRAAIAADEIGCTSAIVRTINPVQINNFVSAFGKESVTEVYQDKEDIQADRKYYLINLIRK